MAIAFFFFLVAGIRITEGITSVPSLNDRVWEKRASHSQRALTNRTWYHTLGHRTAESSPWIVKEMCVCVNVNNEIANRLRFFISIAAFTLSLPLFPSFYTQSNKKKKDYKKNSATFGKLQEGRLC